VIGLSEINGFTTGVIPTPEIAQVQLGDFAFKDTFLITIAEILHNNPWART